MALQQTATRLSIHAIFTLQRRNEFLYQRIAPRPVVCGVGKFERDEWTGLVQQNVNHLWPLMPFHVRVVILEFVSCYATQRSSEYVRPIQSRIGLRFIFFIRRRQDNESAHSHGS